MSHTVLCTYTWTAGGKSHTVNIIKVEHSNLAADEIYDEIMSDDDYSASGYRPITKLQLTDLGMRFPGIAELEIVCGPDDDFVMWHLNPDGWGRCDEGAVFDERFRYAIIAICDA